MIFAPSEKNAFVLPAKLGFQVNDFSSSVITLRLLQEALAIFAQLNCMSRLRFRILHSMHDCWGAILNINFIMLWVMSSSHVPFVFYSWYQKRISDYISRLQLYSYFRRGGLEIGLIFSLKNLESSWSERGQMHRDTVFENSSKILNFASEASYIYLQKNLWWFVFAPWKCFQILSGHFTL